MTFDGIKATASAKRHRVNRWRWEPVIHTGQTFYAVNTAGEVVSWWIGTDPTGVVLEVAGVFRMKGHRRVLVVFHVMPHEWNKRNDWEGESE